MKFNIKIDTALTTVQKNFAEHQVEFQDASEVWVKDVAAALEELRNAVSVHGVHASYHKVQSLFYAVPRDNRVQYATYIGALQLAQQSGADMIELDEDDYRRVFNDDWDWRQASKTTNAAYSSRKGV
jgi:hypothetical protein